MSASNKKRIQLFAKEREPLVLDIGRFISTFQRYGDCVRTVICAKLGEDSLEMIFDRGF
jgi:hypothetical protein